MRARSQSHKLCRFRQSDGPARVGLLDGASILDLSAVGVPSITSLLEGRGIMARLRALVRQGPPRIPTAKARLLSPVEGQEVWAAGVTYFRSRTARMEESEHSATAYDLVYDAPRPELFFKSLPGKEVGPGGEVGIRRDGRWNVPEPELVIVMNSRGAVVGYTVGNDMSSRDIEGENLLYLPQAKIYERSCAVGPCIVVGVDEREARSWKVRLWIRRKGRIVFQGGADLDQIKRSLRSLAGYLFRCQSLPHGAVLLTGTNIVPADDFALRAGDVVRIEISGIGVLENTVRVV